MRKDVTLVMTIMMPHHHRKLVFFFFLHDMITGIPPSCILDMSSLSVPMRCDFPSFLCLYMSSDV